MADLQTYLNEHRQRHLDELLELLRIPSVSTDPERAGDVRRAAEFVADNLRTAGFHAELHETPRHPVVYAERMVDPSLPTVLVYGHYDVQPADPLELWDHPPFEPTVVDDAIVARGASDDKGQVFAHVKGAEALLAVDGELPLNVKFLVEGEEEIGSPNLDAYLQARGERLAADVVVISDGSMIAPDTPTVTYGLKGLAYVEVRVRSVARDLHSGAYGGGVLNPINALAGMIARLHDEHGRVTIPGFYDGIPELDAAERASIGRIPFDEAAFRAEIGATASPGEAGYTLLERLWARPTLDVNGIGGGFQGVGAKTVIPATAMAKISCRLVPGQDPDDITRKLGAYLEELAPDGLEVEVENLHGGHPAMTSLDAPSMEAATAALRAVFGRDPLFVRTGGSIPVVASFQRLLGAEVLLVDLGLETDRIHSPNERFRLRNYHHGIHVGAELLRALGKRAAELG